MIQTSEDEMGKLEISHPSLNLSNIETNLTYDQLKN